MPCLLMVTFDFPPSNRVAVHRSLSFAHHLSQSGWKVVVLTVKEDCYEAIDHKLFYPPELQAATNRTCALDARKIGVKGKYIDWLTIPDEWMSWLVTALPKGRALIKEHQPDILWSTCPPFTPHIVAGLLARYANLPWIADYRDPASRTPIRGQYWAIVKTDKFAVKNATRVVFATEESRELYLQRYGQSNEDKFCVIENGYYDLPDIDRSKCRTEKKSSDKFRVLYSGSIYGSRDPTVFLAALREMMDKNLITVENFEMVFQGTEYEENLKQLISKYVLEHIVVVQPPVGFQESLVGMHSADALLLIQGQQFNPQIPAKAYEYIASQRPIIGLCHLDGATAKLMEKIPQAYVANTIDEAVAALTKVLMQEAVGAGGHSQYSRLHRSQALEAIMLEVIGGVAISKPFVG